MSKPRLVDRCRRPTGLMEQTGWLFTVCVMLSLLLTLPAPMLAGGAQHRLLTVFASAALVFSWIQRYRKGGPSVLLDVVELGGTALFAATCPVPDVAFGFVFASLWQRALYGPTARVVLHCTGVAAAMIAAVPLWTALHGPVAELPASTVFGALPVMFLSALVARHLVLVLVAREQSQRRDDALARLGSALLGITDREEIYALAWTATASICEATPGLRVMVLIDHPDGLLVVGSAGSFRSVPAVLPLAVLPPDRTAGELAPLADAGPLTRAAGFDGQWLCVPLPEQPEGTMVLGSPGAVPQDGLVAIWSTMNQVALALSASDAHQELEQQAHTDALTGLANRAAFHSALGQVLSTQGATPVLLFIDLDDFKTVNDGMGHAAGDALLRSIAGRLRAALRPQDVCARLGGDEFAVLLVGDRQEQATSVAARLVEVVAAPVQIGDTCARVGASIGVARGEVGVDADGLVQRADVAMYAAKAKGKNRVQVFEASLLQIDDRLTFEQELAAAADAGQLVLHYQPVVSTVDGRCTAVEALVRWQHPTRGLLLPQDFIPAAERTGAVVGIGAAVLSEACRFAVEQHERSGAVLPVHVNVSAAQLVHRTFVDQVARCIDELGVCDGQLVLEITESMVLDSPAVRESLTQLVALGVVLAVDDFGTGYSSLTTLRTLPLHIVKIDKSFVAGCPDSPADATVVEAIVQMAGRLGLRTIAEGVERAVQEDFLRRAGVHEVQGFLHRRAAPGPEVTAWLAQPGQRRSALAAALPHPRTGELERA